jgi:hypothetical protein
MAKVEFDTLLQMGRWFGYRPGYIDLCRVYTPKGLYESFREVALALDDLRKDLDRMAKAGKTPEQFGLRIRTPSEGLLITAANKLRTGQNVQVRFAGELVQSLEIPRRNQAALDNINAVDDLLKGLPAPSDTVRGNKVPHRIWIDVDADRVLRFLENYQAYETAAFLDRCDNLRSFIRQQVRSGELTVWTVVVVSKWKGEKTIEVGGEHITRIHRTHIHEGDTTSDRLVLQGVVGTEEEGLDLSEEEYGKVEAALQATSEEEAGKRDLMREMRPADRGLLLIYPIDPQRGDENAPNYVPSVAISFPTSDTAQPLEYRVNEVWLQRHGLIGDWNADGQTI